MEKTTLSVQELAARLGISLPVAYDLVKRPDFPALRIGSRILIPVDGLQTWLNRQTNADQSETGNPGQAM